MQENSIVRIAVDTMGGDYGPSELVAGAIRAARDESVHVFLVGDSSAVKLELDKSDTRGLPITCIPSESKILDEEQPALAMRQKPRASIIVATKLVRQGKADAVVSMGSTGATMAAAAIIFGVIDGIDRPAIGGPIIGSAPDQIILDLGSNLDCRPSQLLGFGAIGDVFARQFLGVKNPRVALLSVGTESEKGNKQVKETFALLTRSSLNFIGNIEANQLPEGRADVVVCDGFVGNIVLKLVEGLSRDLMAQVQSSLAGKMPEQILENLVADLYRRNNVVEARGGGPVFGVNGVSIVGHGNARSGAVERAIQMAKMAVATGFVARLNKEVPIVMATVEGE